MAKTQYKSISISLPEEIVQRVDILAQESYKTRSDIIRETLLQRVMPTYSPSKAESVALNRARSDMQKGEVTNWDTFIHELES